MATIHTFNITSVAKSQINFSYSYKSEAYNDGPDYRETFREESGFVWSFTTTGGTSSNSPCNYTMGGTGNSIYTLKATLTYNYSTGYYGWVFISSRSNTNKTSVPDDVIGDTYKYEYEIDKRWTEDGETYYNYTRYYYETEKKYNVINASASISKTLTFYPHPVTFTFANCVSGKTWKIDNGLNSLITNINDFQKYAQQWKSWKGQSSASTCPSFFDSSNCITAVQMNAVYDYVVNKKDLWNSGDEISAAMFNDLATAINN